MKTAPAIMAAKITVISLVHLVAFKSDKFGRKGRTKSSRIISPIALSPLERELESNAPLSPENEQEVVSYTRTLKIR